MLKLFTSLFLFFLSLQVSGSSYIRVESSKDQKLQSFSLASLTEVQAKPFEDIEASLPLPTVFPPNFAGEDSANVSGKVAAYNTKSDNYIEVSENAVENSNALVPCDESPNGCPTSTNSPTQTPMPTSGPTSTPTPTVTPTPHPIATIPVVTITPFPECKDIVCPMIACLDEQLSTQIPEIIYEDCRCPCSPRPIF